MLHRHHLKKLKDDCCNQMLSINVYVSAVCLVSSLPNRAKIHDLT